MSLSKLSPTPSITSAQSRVLKDVTLQLKKNRLLLGNLKKFLPKVQQLLLFLPPKRFVPTDAEMLQHLVSSITTQLGGKCYESMQLLEDIPISDVSDVVESATAQPASCCTTTGRRVGNTFYIGAVFCVVSSIVAFTALFSKTADVLHDIPAEYWTLFHGSLQWIYLGVAVMAVLGGCSLCYTCLKK